MINSAAQRAQTNSLIGVRRNGRTDLLGQRNLFTEAQLGYQAATGPIFADGAQCKFRWPRA